MDTMNAYRIDSIRFSDREGFYDEAAAAFGFPEYFGRNLDALADCLADLERPLRVEWLGASKSRRELGGFFDEAAAVFREYSDEFEILESPF